ncbi:MAG: histidine phosphatase family protein [Planctomycetota bacterium]
MITCIRHAPVALNFKGRCYGALDVAPSIPHSDAAATALASMAQGSWTMADYDEIWSSDLARCRGLADAMLHRAAGEGAGQLPPLKLDARLRELDHGAFEGRAWEEIHGSEPDALARWGERWQSEGPPDGESAEALGGRVAAWLGDRSEGRRLLLVAHAGVVRALHVHLLGLSWSDAMAIEVPHLRAVQLR